MANILTFEPEHSSHISHMSYDPDSKTLHVRFHERKKEDEKEKDKEPRTYMYAGVPPHVFAAMTRHPSAGRYFHNVIKRHYKLI